MKRSIAVILTLVIASAAQAENNNGNASPIRFTVPFAQGFSYVESDRVAVDRDIWGNTLAALLRPISAGRLPLGSGVCWLTRQGAINETGAHRAKLAELVGHDVTLSDFRLTNDGQMLLSISYWYGGTQGYELVTFSPRTGTLSRWITDDFVQKLAGQPRFVSDAAFLPSPRGDVWVFVRAGYAKETQAAVVTRDGRVQRVPLPGNFAGWMPSDLVYGAVDFEGRYYVLTQSQLWRLSPAGAELLGEVNLPTDGVRSAPVVMPNGDVWVAVSVGSDRTEFTTRLNERQLQLHTMIEIWGSAALVRIRPVKGTQPRVDVIPGSSIQQKIAAIGLPARSKIMHMNFFRYDFATGGLITFDRMNEVMFAIKPE